MIDLVQESPADLRRAIYDLARYKLHEQFTHADVKELKRAQTALETAIRGVEAFSRQNARLPDRPPTPQIADVTPAAAPAGNAFPAESRPHAPPAADARRRGSKDPGSTGAYLRRGAVVTALVVGGLLVWQQRARLQPPAPTPPQVAMRPATVELRPPMTAKDPAPPAPARPAPPRPTDYGVYAVSDDRLIELKPLPGRAPDIRVAVSAALKIPSRTTLPHGHPTFIVFRRDAASGTAAEVRVVARISREFSADAVGRRPDDGEDAWVIRNVSFPFRISPVADNPAMVEIHSEDPELELAPGRYVLVLTNQSYDFTVEGNVTDRNHCIERIIATNGTFYSECGKP